MRRLLLLLGLAQFVCSVSPDPIRAKGPSGRKAIEPPLTVADRAYWAFQTPHRPSIPEIQDRAWVRSPVDVFILARLEKVGLPPAAPADRAALLRRVTFDLTGLPPAPGELADFLNDHRPGAYGRVVERLLASPHYGERWAQHWLDVVRYAESNGYEADGERPHAWHYRDHVIRAFNDDKPYDRFVVEQLAGDQLARGKDPRECTEVLVATGFNRCGPVHVVAGNTDPEVNRQEVLTEMTGAVGSAFLGLTVGCARCHDHKFDPISQADYYRLEAFFAAAQPHDIDLATPEDKALHEQRVQELNARLDPLRKKVADLEAPYKTLLTQLKQASLEPKYQAALDADPKKRTPEQKKLVAHAEILIKVNWDELLEALTPAERAQRAQWRQRIHALEARMPAPPPRAWAIRDDDDAPPTYVLKRGNVKQRGAVVEPALPRILSAGTRPTGRLDRLALARWLVRPDHPLTARVMVNRIWQHHFGRGLVATPNDFGAHGARPSHARLLDWLACEFVASGWSVKHMHRLILMSNTYRQASHAPVPARARQVDPENHLLWRMNRQRLEGEALRDSVLAAAATLNAKPGGPMVRVPLEPEVAELIFTEGEPDEVWRVTPDRREHTRRSIYLYAKRNVRLPLFEAFDRPDLLTSCPVRPVSTFAPQAFILLNGPFMQQQSKAFASRLLCRCWSDARRQIQEAYTLALSRPPSTAELHMARDFLAAQADLLRDRLRARLPVGLPVDLRGDVDPAAAAALADFCLALLNRNEFLYVN
ncbi:MAG TPA: DUF1549 and DUF1553 domain-containing protein [Gemmataceae bacterium]|nr:DUF1549 and DUF1553 domain-containing protein [Gemmataceae bacterium]